MGAPTSAAELDVAVRDPDSGEVVVVTVREPRFRAGLEAAAAARPLIEALAEAGGAEADPADIDAALAVHAGVWIGLAARATGRDPAWVERLGAASADAVGDALWRTHAEFLSRRVAAARPGRG